MSITLNRREFIGSTLATAAAGSLVFGFATSATAQGMAPEVNAWVVVQPDEKVIIRIARSEMGQGTLTGLAQMVAEELECDWARVTTEYPTPGQNLARKRVWGNYSTGGSRGIRESQEYVRKGGAAARMMLVPSGTVMSKPSMVNVTICLLLAAGVPKSRSGMMKSFIRRPPSCGKSRQGNGLTPTSPDRG